MVVDIIKLVPLHLEELNLKDAGFEEKVGEELCDAVMLYSSVTTLKFIDLSGHPNWFNSNKKCYAWRNVF